MKPSGIGGQALMEGVMMKNGNLYACAVRKPDNEIIVDVQETKPIADRCPIFKWPILRGMVTFVDSMYIGVKTLTWSASFFEDEEDGKKSSDSKKNSADKAEEAARPAEKTAKDKTKESLFMAGTVAISIVLAVGIFMILPYFLSLLLKKFIDSPTILAICEGVIRIALFVGYVAAISCMKDIRRVFMYHGAEHKSINCVEHGYELTVSNVKKCSREHKRCGTSFLLIVMVISVVFFVFIRVESTWLMVLIRLLLVPIIAGISYEFIRLAGRSESKFVAFLSKPGLALQNFTTREPDDSMIECAIASVEAVFDWRKYQEEAKQEQEEAQRAKESSLDRKRRERNEESRKRLKARGMEDSLSEEREREIDARADKATEGQEIDVDAEIAAFVARKREEARRAAEAAYSEQSAEASGQIADTANSDADKSASGQAAAVNSDTDKAASDKNAGGSASKDTKTAAEKTADNNASGTAKQENEQQRMEERTRNLKSEIEADVARDNRSVSKKAEKKEAIKQSSNENSKQNASQKSSFEKKEKNAQNTVKQDNSKQAASKQDNSKQAASKQDNSKQNAPKQNEDSQNKAKQSTGRYVPGNHAVPSKQEPEDEGDFKGNETMNGYFKRPEKKDKGRHAEMGGYYTSTNRNNVYVETMSPIENDADEQDDVLNALDKFFVGKKTENKKDGEGQDKSESDTKKENNQHNSKKKAKKKK